MPNSLPKAPEAAQPAAPSPFQPVQTEGFPWTGLTLVLVVIALIAFMAVPTGPVSPKARAAERIELPANLALGELRAAIRSYYHDHHAFPGENPRASTKSEGGVRWFERQLRLNTDDEGNPAGAVTPDHPHGPYLPGGIPMNPINELSTVKLVETSESFEPDDSTGWVFFRSEGVIRLNTSSMLRGSRSRYYDL